MPTPNPSTRREYKGAAANTTITAPLTAGSGSVTIASYAGWPTGAVGKFVVEIDYDTAAAEKVLCVTQSTGTVTFDAAGRGWDGTTATSHNSGAKIRHCYTAFDADEANAHTAATTGVHGVAGSVVGTTDTQTLTNKTLTSPVLTTPVVNGSGGLLTLPAGPDTLVGRATTDTLTNKTLTSPTINAATLTGIVTSSGTFSPPTAATIAVTVKGAAAQTANLQEWQDSTSAQQAMVTAAGAVWMKSLVFFSANTAGTAGALQGYVIGQVNGTAAKFPYYAI